MPYACTKTTTMTITVPTAHRTPKMEFRSIFQVKNPSQTEAENKECSQVGANREH